MNDTTKLTESKVLVSCPVLEVIDTDKQTKTVEGVVRCDIGNYVMCKT